MGYCEPFPFSTTNNIDHGKFSRLNLHPNNHHCTITQTTQHNSHSLQKFIADKIKTFFTTCTKPSPTNSLSGTMLTEQNKKEAFMPVVPKTIYRSLT
jgi:hypothetical protein